MLYKAKTLNGYRMKAKDGEIGKVKEFYFDDKHWTIRYLVADTGTWLTGKQVLISPYALLSINENGKYISVNLTKKQIEDSPSLDTDKPVSKQFQNSYYEYYGLPSYWTGSSVWGVNSYINRDYQFRSNLIPVDDESWDPNLRSTHDVSGHHLEATDGAIGHVADFLIDDKSWTIRYLVIDTQNFFPGRKVLISPQWIESVSWEESKVFVNVSREKVKSSPEYTDQTRITREYEDRFHHHYQRKGYWIEEKAHSKPFPHRPIKKANDSIEPNIY